MNAPIRPQHDSGWSPASTVLSRLAVSLLMALAFLATTSTSASAENFRAEILVEGLTFPVSIRSLPSGDDDFLVVEKFGDVRLIRDGELLEAPVAAFDVATGTEAGLLSIALYPDFESSGRFIVSYTPAEPLDKFYLTRLELDGDRARVLDEPFIELPSRPETDIHYGGNLRFGPDGALYMGAGELNRRSWAQDSEREAGSMLRYNADGTIPDDNPFGDDNPVWATGLRNPFDFDFTTDGRLLVADNGQDANDEIHEARAGENYGWPLIEGYCDNFPLVEPCEDASDFTDPVYEFRTIIGTTGVLFYDNDAIPSLTGQLLVGGWHSRSVRRFDVGESGEPLEPAGTLYESSGDTSITDVDVGADGSVLLLTASRDLGRIIRITDAPDDITPGGEQSGEDPADDSSESDGGCSTAADGSAGPASLLVLFAAVLLARRRRM